MICKNNIEIRDVTRFVRDENIDKKKKVKFVKWN